MTFLVDKTSDANAKAKAELVAAATDGKVKLINRKAGHDDEEEDKSVSEKFTKPDFIEVTGNKSVTFRI